jgi:hypothetical protein
MNTPSSHDLNVQAFLYASGELEETEAVCFERRLAEEQAAREALSQAVLLCQPLGSFTAAPDPGYRECVRRRLRPRPGMECGSGRPRVDRGHPVLWCLLGAAAVLLVLALERTSEHQRVQAQLHEMAQELVDLDIQVLDLKAEQLEQKLGHVEDELLETREHGDRRATQRHQDSPDKANPLKQ